MTDISPMLEGGGTLQWFVVIYMLILAYSLCNDRYRNHGRSDIATRISKEDEFFNTKKSDQW